MLINGLPSLETCRVKHTTDVVYLLPGTISNSIYSSDVRKWISRQPRLIRGMHPLENGFPLSTTWTLHHSARNRRVDIRHGCIMYTSSVRSYSLASNCWCRAELDSAWCSSDTGLACIVRLGTWINGVKRRELVKRLPTSYNKAFKCDSQCVAFRAT